jgi:hypothetical protein
MKIYLPLILPYKIPITRDLKIIEEKKEKIINENYPMMTTMQGSIVENHENLRFENNSKIFIGVGVGEVFIL